LRRSFSRQACHLTAVHKSFALYERNGTRDG
jgi:hypothetical protein